MDSLNDTGHQRLFKIAARTDIPSYVLDTPLLDKSAAADLPESAFADSANRLFPIDSSASCWLSAAYFATTVKQAAAECKHFDAKETLSAIRRAASTYGILHDVDATIEKLSAAPPPAPFTERWGWDDGKERKYPLHNAELVKAASSYFADNRAKYPSDMRRRIATEIVRAAAIEKVAVCREVEAEAGLGAPRPDTFVEDLKTRAYLAKHAAGPAWYDVLRELAKSAEDGTLAKSTQADLDETERVIEAFDKAAGLTGAYADGLPTPADVVRSITRSEAEKLASDSVHACGYVFSAESLSKLPASVYAPLGDSFVKAASAPGTLKEAVKALGPVARQAFVRLVTQA